MKRKSLPGTALLFFVVLLFASCEKDDELKVDQLLGTWTVANDHPDLQAHGSVNYTFNADKTASIYSSNILSDKEDVLTNLTYTIGKDKKLITFFNEGGTYTEQYTILKMTSKEMRWENASPFNGLPNKKLLKKR